jgi:integrase
MAIDREGFLSVRSLSYVSELLEGERELNHDSVSYTQLSRDVSAAFADFARLAMVNDLDLLHLWAAGSNTDALSMSVDDWYAHLVRRKRASVNPVAGLEDEYRWSRRANGTDESPSNPALDPDHVRALYEAATSPGERLLVVALCGWGLRSGEVAALHRSQLVLNPPDADVPHVHFEERKNGPGQVSILFGRDAALDRLAELGERNSWNGYLFPSSRSASGHRTRQTILSRFDDLAERAELPDDIAGTKPVPQMARRFWYDAYSTTQEAILEEVGEIAAEQGSASAEVVLQEYLSPERRRRLRREYMRERLDEAFGEVST